MALPWVAVFLLSISPTLAVQLSASNPPLRDLKWGQLNFLHTTDTHGWLAGHLQEYSLPPSAGMDRMKECL